MIVGRLIDWKNTPQARPFQRVVQFLEEHANSSLTPERHEILGDHIFALAQKAPSRLPSEGKFEAHRRYVDVQYLISGLEEIGVIPRSEVTVLEPYSAEKEIEFYHPPTSYTKLAMLPGMLAVFYPEDVHLPNCDLNGRNELHKVVVKVELSWLLDQ